MSAWLFYALLAPALFAVLNIIDKVLREKHFGTLSLTVTGGLFAILASLGFLFVDYNLSAVAAAAAIIGGMVWFLAGFPYFKALSVEEASRVVPLWQLQSPITLVLASVFLNERLALQDYASFALIVAGAFLISLKKSGLSLGPAFYLILVAATGTSISSVIAKGLYSGNQFWPVQLMLLAGNFIGAAAVMLLFRDLRRKVFKELAASSDGAKRLLLLRQLLGLVAFMVLTIAILTGPVSITIAISGLSGFFVFVAATVISFFWPAVLKEVVDKKALLTKASAIAMILAGLFLLAVMR